MNMKDKRTALKGVSLQHRHFAFIAHALRQTKPEGDDGQWREVVYRFMTECRSSNGRFDKDRFLSACGID